MKRLVVLFLVLCCVVWCSGIGFLTDASGNNRVPVAIFVNSHRLQIQVQGKYQVNGKDAQVINLPLGGLSLSFSKGPVSPLEELLVTNLESNQQHHLLCSAWQRSKIIQMKLKYRRMEQMNADQAAKDLENMKSNSSQEAQSKTNTGSSSGNGSGLKKRRAKRVLTKADLEVIPEVESGVSLEQSITDIIKGAQKSAVEAKPHSGSVSLEQSITDMIKDNAESKKTDELKNRPSPAKVSFYQINSDTSPSLTASDSDTPSDALTQGTQVMTPQLFSKSASSSEEEAADGPSLEKLVDVAAQKVEEPATMETKETPVDVEPSSVPAEVTGPQTPSAPSKEPVGMQENVEVTQESSVLEPIEEPSPIVKEEINEPPKTQVPEPHLEETAVEKEPIKVQPNILTGLPQEQSSAVKEDVTVPQVSQVAELEQAETVPEPSSVIMNEVTPIPVANAEVPAQEKFELNSDQEHIIEVEQPAVISEQSNEIKKNEAPVEFSSIPIEPLDQAEAVEAPIADTTESPVKEPSVQVDRVQVDENANTPIIEAKAEYETPPSEAIENHEPVSDAQKSDPVTVVEEAESKEEKVAAEQPIPIIEIKLEDEPEEDTAEKQEIEQPKILEESSTVPQENNASAAETFANKNSPVEEVVVEEPSGVEEQPGNAQEDEAIYNAEPGSEDTKEPSVVQESPGEESVISVKPKTEDKSEIKEPKVIAEQEVKVEEPKILEQSGDEEIQTALDQPEVSVDEKDKVLEELRGEDEALIAEDAVVKEPENHNKTSSECPTEVPEVSEVVTEEPKKADEQILEAATSNNVEEEPVVIQLEPEVIEEQPTEVQLEPEAIVKEPQPTALVAASLEDQVNRLAFERHDADLEPSHSHGAAKLVAIANMTIVLQSVRTDDKLLEEEQSKRAQNQERIEKICESIEVMEEYPNEIEMLQDGDDLVFERAQIDETGDLKVVSGLTTFSAGFWATISASRLETEYTRLLRDTSSSKYSKARFVQWKPKKNECFMPTKLNDPNAVYHIFGHDDRKLALFPGVRLALSEMAENCSPTGMRGVLMWNEKKTGMVLKAAAGIKKQKETLDTFMQWLQGKAPIDYFEQAQIGEDAAQKASVIVHSPPLSVDEINNCVDISVYYATIYKQVFMTVATRATAPSTIYLSVGKETANLKLMIAGAFEAYLEFATKLKGADVVFVSE